MMMIKNGKAEIIPICEICQSHMLPLKNFKDWFCITCRDEAHEKEELILKDFLNN